MFEGRALAEALTQHGHAVSERTVQRWKAGITRPKPQDVSAIRRLLDIKEEAAPDVPGRLDEIERKLDQVLAATSSLVETSPDLQDALRALIERIEGTQLPGGEAPLETDPESDQVEQRPEDRGVG